MCRWCSRKPHFTAPKSLLPFQPMPPPDGVSWCWNSCAYSMTTLNEMVSFTLACVLATDNHTFYIDSTTLSVKEMTERAGCSAEAHQWPLGLRLCGLRPHHNTSSVVRQLKKNIHNYKRAKEKRVGAYESRSSL